MELIGAGLLTIVATYLVLRFLKWRSHNMEESLRYLEYVRQQAARRAEWRRKISEDDEVEGKG